MNETDGQSVMKVKGEMTVFVAVKLRDKLMACLQESGSLILDLEDVDECDVAGIQLIVSARMYADRTGTHFSVANVSKTVTDTLSQAGIDPAIVR